MGRSRGSSPAQDGGLDAHGRRRSCSLDQSKEAGTRDVEGKRGRRKECGRKFARLIKRGRTA